MGGFYLDVIKDRQYTCKADSKARRSAQTAMYLIVSALAKWMAPILSFTAEDIWQNIPAVTAESIFLTQWSDKLKTLPKASILSMSEWQKVQVVRDEVNKAIEAQRSAGRLGSALEAEVTLFADKDLFATLDKLQDELRFVLITSQAKLLPLEEAAAAINTDLIELKLTVTASSAEKCVRCWHRCADIGSDVKRPELCQRCVTNITTEEGEERYYA